METINELEKIDFYKIYNIYRIKNIIGFRSYLVYIWKELSSRSENGNKGINKITFAKYFELPGLIQEQLFSIFSSYSNCIVEKNFVNNMMLLYTKEYENLISFVFKMYDFNKNNKISKEDIRVLLSYIPLNRPQISSKNQSDEFENRIETQEELYNKLDFIFKGKKYLDENEFKFIVENQNSDIFLYLIIFIFEKSPFNKKTIEILDNLEKSQNIKSIHYEDKSKFIKGPSQNTLFKPNYGLLTYYQYIENICKNKPKKTILNFNKNKIDNVDIRNKNRLLSYQFTMNNIEDNLNKIIGDNLEREKNNKKEETKFERKIQKKHNSYKTKINSLVNKSNNNNDNNHSKNTFDKISDLNDEEYNETYLSFSDDNFTESSEEESENMIEEIPDKIKGNYSGYIYKLIDEKKMKKFFCVLCFKDLFYYKKINDLAFVAINNLTNINYKIENEIIFKDKLLYRINLISSEKIISLFIESKDELLSLVNNLEKAIVKYINIKEKYEFKKTIEEGKFGLIKKGINKITNEEVVITIMSKEDMNFLDITQLRNEIEILKIINHPYIGKVYDIFENSDNYYKITEYYKGSDLLSYFQKRKNKLCEKRVSEIIREISIIIYYLQQYGIIHGDLKPENILMTDESENAEIRLLDFFSGQFIGQGDYCGYGIGTLPYSPPEFLLKKPINKQIDLWALGVISYFLLSGNLPYYDHFNNYNNNNSNSNDNYFYNYSFHNEEINDENVKEVEKKILNEEVSFPDKYWKNISEEAKNFVEGIFFI